METEKGKELNPVTVNRRLTVIKHMFRKTVDWGLVKANPATGVKRFTVVSERTRFLTGNEVQMFWPSVKLTSHRRGFYPWSPWL